jgi:hypothetical protein
MILAQLYHTLFLAANQTREQRAVPLQGLMSSGLCLAAIPVFAFFVSPAPVESAPKHPDYIPLQNTRQLN